MDYIWQLILNGISSGSLYFLVAAGFSLNYSAVRFFNFTHGLLFTSTAYLLFALSQPSLGVPPVLSIPIAVVFIGLSGLLLDLAVFRPLRKRGTTPLILLLASLGLYVAGQNSISLLFGDNTQSVRTAIVQVGYSMGGARISPIQLGIVVCAILVFFLLSAIMKKTRWGKAIRATSVNEKLAELSGIQTNKIISVSIFLGSTITAIAGVLHGYDVDLTPTMGMNPMMAGVVVMIIGGISSINGIFLGGFFLAITQQLGAAAIGSEWKDAIAFVVLIIFLALRPQGILGRRIHR